MFVGMRTRRYTERALLSSITHVPESRPLINIEVHIGHIMSLGHFIKMAALHCLADAILVIESCVI